MICPAVDQIPLAAVVYCWAWLTLSVWACRGQPTGRAVLTSLIALIWPVTIVLALSRSRKNVR
jgi:hypothetical protein